MSQPQTTQQDDLAARYAELERLSLKQEREIAALTEKIRWFEEQQRLAALRAFAAKSEKTVAQQQRFVFNEAEVEVDAALLTTEPTVVTITYQRRKKKGQREEQIKDLPVETITYELNPAEQICPCCDGPLHKMSEEVREELKFNPASLTLVRKVRHVYSCRSCEENDVTTPVITATMPAPAFPQSLASASAVAYIMTQKFVEGLPLYRQEKSWERFGISLPRQTLANWMLKGAAYLAILEGELKTILLSNDILHADETTFQVLHEPGREAQTKSYLWLYRTGRDGPPIVLFEYQPTRAGEHPKRFLESFKGYLHVDCYGAYDAVLDVILVGCWSHARRKFYEALMALPKELRITTPPTTAQSGSVAPSGTAAQVGLEFCDKLFRIDRKFKNASPDDRYAGRIKKSKPHLDEFKVWLDAQSLDVAPKTALGTAIKYCLNNWGKLTNFLLDGRLEIDNNRSERSIRPFVVGRKNWLFANTQKGAKASATIYSIIETAKENGLNPFHYLTYLFEQFPNIDTTDRDAIRNLLPWSETLPSYVKVPAKTSKTDI